MKNRRSKKPAKNGQRNNYKDRDHLTDSGAEGKFDRRDCYKSDANDPMWYAENAQLLSDYASFPFGAPLGTNLFPTLPLQQNIAAPGIMSLYYIPTLGNAKVETDPINIAMRNIYTYVRHANSGHSNYDAPDLMMYLMAMDSALMYHSFLKRVYGVIMDYTPTNRYYPLALIRAMGVDPDDLRSHISDFRGFVNQYALRIGANCIPNSMSYMARHSWMTEGLYTDSMSPKAQTYLYVPYGFYQFTLSGSPAVGSLTMRKLFDPVSLAAGTQTLNKVSDLIEFGNSLLNPIITNEDFGIMSGDILKAFGDSGVVKVTGIADGYMVLPLYSQEVLSQIENSTVLGMEFKDGSITVNQNTGIGGGYLTENLALTFNLSMFNYAQGSKPPFQMFEPLTFGRVLNFHHANPTAAEVMVATRLTTILTVDPNIVVDGDGLYPIPITYCGSELLTHAAIVTYTGSTINLNNVDFSLVKYNFIEKAVTDIQQQSQIHRFYALLANFDWAPQLLAITVAADGSAAAAASMLFSDLDVYTTLSQTNYRDLHATALLSEFSVPQMGGAKLSLN